MQSLERKWTWRNQASLLQTVLQRIQSSKQYDTGTKTETYKDRRIEQDRKSRNKPTHLWSTNL